MKPSGRIRFEREEIENIILPYVRGKDDHEIGSLFSDILKCMRHARRNIYNVRSFEGKQGIPKGIKYITLHYWLPLF
ncbi:MAG TPA: hypothetical protein VK616_00550 [Flavitalea sp.]|nr:hypothetical protein [Flavitalea sp.]